MSNYDEENELRKEKERLLLELSKLKKEEYELEDLSPLEEKKKNIQLDELSDIELSDIDGPESDTEEELVVKRVLKRTKQSKNIEKEEKKYQPKTKGNQVDEKQNKRQYEARISAILRGFLSKTSRLINKFNRDELTSEDEDQIVKFYNEKRDESVKQISLYEQTLPRNFNFTDDFLDKIDGQFNSQDDKVEKFISLD